MTTVAKDGTRVRKNAIMQKQINTNKLNLHSYATTQDIFPFVFVRCTKNILFSFFLKFQLPEVVSVFEYVHHPSGFFLASKSLKQHL